MSAFRQRRRPDSRVRISPLRPFDRVVAGYATLAFAFGAAESAIMGEWSFALLGGIMTVAGVALLLHDHRRWRASRAQRRSTTST